MVVDFVGYEGFIGSIDFVEPVCDGVNSFGDVVLRDSVVEITDATTLIKIRLVDEMPWCLPSTSMPLDVICKSGTLYHWVVSFILNDVAIVFLQNSEDVVNSLDNHRIFLVEDLEGHSSDHHVSLATPGLDLVENECENE